MKPRPLLPALVFVAIAAGFLWARVAWGQEASPPAALVGNDILSALLPSLMTSGGTGGLFLAALFVAMKNGWIKIGDRAAAAIVPDPMTAETHGIVAKRGEDDEYVWPARARKALADLDDLKAGQAQAAKDRAEDRALHTATTAALASLTATLAEYVEEMRIARGARGPR